MNPRDLSDGGTNQAVANGNLMDICNLTLGFSDNLFPLRISNTFLYVFVVVFFYFLANTFYVIN